MITEILIGIIVGMIVGTAATLWTIYSFSER